MWKRIVWRQPDSMELALLRRPRRMAMAEPATAPIQIQIAIECVAVPIATPTPIPTATQTATVSRLSFHSGSPRCDVPNKPVLCCQRRKIDA
jgi:hypothetical protein